MDTGLLDEIRGKLDFSRAGKPMLIGMAAILVMVAVVSGYVLSGAATSSKLEVVPSGNDAGDSGQIAEPTLYVHVSGAVARPGLYEIQSGSRVADAIEAAGGFSEDANTDSCNLARILEDGEHVIISAKGELETGSPDDEGRHAGSEGGGLLNINTATAEQLEALPGIGTSTAQKIVADRMANGPFKSVNDLTRVSGIGEKKLEALIGLICV